MTDTSADTAAAGGTTVATTTADYLVGVTMGQGSFGTVLYGKHKRSDQPVAIKVVDKLSLSKNRDHLAATLKEQRLLRRLNEKMQSAASHYVVQLLASFHDRECVYMVLECCLGGDLAHVIQHGQQSNRDDWELRAAHYGWELMQAIEWIHQQQVIHADLSPKNILVTEQGRLRLADFGSAIDMSNNRESSGCGSSDTELLHGSSDYASPEVIQAKFEEISPAIDLWSYGCILVALWTGGSPFHDTTEPLTVERVLDYAAHFAEETGASSFEIVPPHVPKPWRDLIFSLLHPTPGERPACDGDFSAIRLAWESILDGRSAPSFKVVEPTWLVRSKETVMRDGAIGWSAFLME